MKVDERTANRLKEIRSCLESEIKKDETGSDVRGVYDRLVDILLLRVSMDGLDIARGDCYGGLGGVPRNVKECYDNQKRFSQEVVRDVALNKFARYIFYHLKKETNGPCNTFHVLLKKEIEKEAHYNHNWFKGLGKVAKEASYHWGTNLEAVA
ncbi:hypothetical protein A3K64_03505 [Candidatus Micrarchaeota archaeon RBG_16_36_9]|nr:MAG: hypothetical protein A3K64_03505 [Candidatus Micrarchaeota archaeon RBG_16_36_9]